MGKISVNLGLETEEPEASKARPVAPKASTDQTAALAELASGLPSPSQARKDAIRKAPRKAWTFNNMPVPIKEAFEVEADRRGMTMKEFFLHCLRSGGLDIPEYDEIDGRRK
ncbi:hypothetical protein [Rhodospirillum sp. A1_3_36]|uniref:hypothetical protein n=1 Tax=Rhodospirillum sp. A1_3_36 TaxID=3391666 RepID=UPI0039A68AEA